MQECIDMINGYDRSSNWNDFALLP